MKGQSAMEYLMTYGWVILIVIVVASALYALGIFNPNTYTTDRIMGFMSVGTPSGWVYVSDNFNITLINTVGYPIDIINITVNCGLQKSEIQMQSVGNSIVPTGRTKEFYTTSCVSLSQGDQYNVQIEIVYKNTNNNYKSVDKGTITGRAV